MGGGYSRPAATAALLLGFNLKSEQIKGIPRLDVEVSGSLSSVELRPRLSANTLWKVMGNFN